MIKKLSSIFISISIISCNVEGVKENKSNKPNVPDLVTEDTLVEMDTTNVAEVDFDTAFNFSKNKPSDSLFLNSGVKLVYLKKGSGARIKKFDVVAINYRGMLVDGTLIESNEAFQKTIPYVVGLGLTFNAFDEVMEKCKIGDKIRFTIPAAQAYGSKGRGKLIPPNSNLVYEMDLVAHVKGEKTESGVEFFPLISNPKGEIPQEGNTVAITYMGWVKKTGKLFDASAASGKLYEFDLGTGRAIKGWHEVVKRMHRGEKYLLLVPSAAAYGSKGVQELVPPNSDLIYTIELKDFTN